MLTPLQGCQEKGRNYRNSTPGVKPEEHQQALTYALASPAGLCFANSHRVDSSISARRSRVLRLGRGITRDQFELEIVLALVGRDGGRQVRQIFVREFPVEGKLDLGALPAPLTAGPDDPASIRTL